jgi:ribosomal protein S27E
MNPNNKWLCINCGEALGEMVGGELRPDASVPGNNMITRGPNLVVTCPHCNATKVFYTSDPIVRAMHQLVDALSTQMARRAVRELSEEMLRELHKKS